MPAVSTAGCRPCFLPGYYTLGFIDWETRIHLGRSHKLVMRFSICDLGEHFETQIERWYNVRRLTGAPRRRGRFIVGLVERPVSRIFGDCRRDRPARPHRAVTTARASAPGPGRDRHDRSEATAPPPQPAVQRSAQHRTGGHLALPVPMPVPMPTPSSPKPRHIRALGERHGNDQPSGSWTGRSLEHVYPSSTTPTDTFGCGRSPSQCTWTPMQAATAFKARAS